MKRAFGAAVLGLMLLGFAAGQEKPAVPPVGDKAKSEPAKDSFEVIIKEMIKTLNQLGDHLAKATSENAAKDVRKAVEKCVAEMAALSQRSDKLGKLSPEESKKLEEKYKVELDAASKKFSAETERLMALPYGKSLLDALKAKPGKPTGPTPPPAPLPPKDLSN